MADLWSDCGFYNKNEEAGSILNKKYGGNVEIIFAHWLKVMKVRGETKNSILGEKRVRFCQRALRLGYTVDDLKMAIDGCAASDWHMGKNPKTNGKKYNEFCRILADEDRIEMFISLSPAFKKKEEEYKQKVNQKRIAELDKKPWELENISYSQWFEKNYGIKPDLDLASAREKTLKFGRNRLKKETDNAK